MWTAALFMILYSHQRPVPTMSLDCFGGTTVHASIAEIAFSIGMLAGGLLLGKWGGFRMGDVDHRAVVLMGADPSSGLLPKRLLALPCAACRIPLLYNGRLPR